MLWKYGVIVKNQLISMLGKFLFFVLLLGISSNACSQNKEKILYMLPDDVEVQASNYLKRVSKQQEYFFYFVLNKKPDTVGFPFLVQFKSRQIFLIPTTVLMGVV
jgi:hypothetical protein